MVDLLGARCYYGGDKFASWVGEILFVLKIVHMLLLFVNFLAKIENT